MSTPNPAPTTPAVPGASDIGRQLLASLKAALAPIPAGLDALSSDLRAEADPLSPLASLAQLQVSLLKAFPKHFAGLEADLAQVVADEAHRLLGPAPKAS